MVILLDASIAQVVLFQISGICVSCVIVEEKIG